MKDASPGKTFVACCVAMVYLAAGCGQKAPDTSAPAGMAELPGCQAAIAKVDYGNLLVIPDETKSVIESYRADWKTFCGSNPDKPAMADLVLKAKTLERLFDNVFETYIQAHTTEERYSSADAISDLMVKRYPTFVPGFEGSFWEQEYFRPSREEFRKHAQLGTAEDKAFFEAGIGLTTEFPPWIDRTWDYGGCLRFGKFDWTGTLDRIVQLKKTIYSDIYKKLTADHESALIESVTSTGANLCTCERKEAVMEDLRGILSYIEKEPTLSSYLPLLRAQIEAIQTKKVIVNSEMEKHCSGG